MALPRVPRSRPRPKMRAIPRQKTEASAYAEMQQLAIEKQRLRQEQEYLQERQQQIILRTQEIEEAIHRLEAEVVEYRQGDPGSALPPPPPREVPIQSAEGSGTIFSPMMIDY